MKKEDDLGLEVGYAEKEDLEVGEVYPLFGIITDIKEEDGKVIVEINNGMDIEMKEDFGQGKTLVQDGLEEGLKEKSQLTLLNGHLLEKGIFIIELVEKEPQMKFVCHTVVLGKKELTTNH